MRHYRESAAVLATFLSGCTSLATEEAILANEVLQATRAFEQAERDLDVHHLVGTIDPTFYMYQDGKRRSYEEIVTGMRASLPTLKRFDADFRDIEVLVLGPDSASVSFVFFDSVTDAKGTTTRKTGATTMIWRRRPEGWRIVYVDADHYPVKRGRGS